MDRAKKGRPYFFLGLIVCVLCLGIGSGYLITKSGIWLAFRRDISNPTTNSENVIKTAKSSTAVESTMQPAPTSSDAAQETLKALEQTSFPETDWVKLAEEFHGVPFIPATLDTASPNYKNGDELSFWVTNTDTNENKKIEATLQFQTTQIYFWVENGINFDRNQLQNKVDIFANQIYPTDQKFFGKEWIPGVDNDPHLYILYTRGLGNGVSGYTSGLDSVLTAAHEYSNQHEMFYINADIIKLSDNYALSVMAHEYQHVIREYQNPDEESWLNEGFSELATYLNGYPTSGFDQDFAANPDINLTQWPSDSSVHYGSSFLFTKYLFDRFGLKTTQAVADDPLTGLDGLDDTFTKENLKDSHTNQVITSDGFFQDWTLANYLNNSAIGDGRYGYLNLPTMPPFSDFSMKENCITGQLDGDVNQYGTNYLQVNCDQPYQITFNGDSTTKVLSIFPKEGSHYVWSNMVDSADVKMTREFDFTNLTGKIDLSYDAWYDLEPDYDYAYLLASTDGKNWLMIHTSSCTETNTTGNNFGCGYNGNSSGWIHEDVDLSQFAGKKVDLRFEYITDEGVTGEGLVLDAVTIPQLNYQTGFETGDGGWQLDGFTRIENQIPQSFLVALIYGTGAQTVIEKFATKPGQQLTFSIDPAMNGSNITLVVSGSTRYTRQMADYHFTFTSNP